MFIIIFNGNYYALTHEDKVAFKMELESVLINKYRDVKPIINIVLSPGSIRASIIVLDNSRTRELVRKLTTPGTEDYISYQNPIIVNVNGRKFTSL